MASAWRFGGLALHARLPRALGATITYDPGYEARKIAERGGRKSNFVRPLGGFSPTVRTHTPDPVKEIHFKIVWPGEGEPREGSVKINLKTRRVQTGGEALFDNDHNSARGGVQLITLPVAAVCILPIAAARAYYHAIEQREGMSRHGWEIYRKLAPQLEPADAALLREALRNTYEYEQWRFREVDRAEAARFLATCHLRAQEVADDGSIPHDATTHVFHWYTEPEGGECVAQGSFGKDGQGEITVLGSRFLDEEAKALCGSFRTRRAVSED